MFMLSTQQTLLADVFAEWTKLGAEVTRECYLITNK